MDQQPLSPNQLASTPDHKLAAIYQVPAELVAAGNEKHLTDWVMHVLNSAIFGFASGQFAASVPGRSFAGSKVVFLHPGGLPPQLHKLFSQSPVTTQGITVEFVWEATGGAMQGRELEMVEVAIRQILAELNTNPRQAFLLWATSIGIYRKAGLLVIDKDSKEQFPYEGAIPPELEQAVVMHQQVTYQTTGSAWASLTVLWTPEGEFTVEPENDANEWAKPVPEAAWAEFQAMFPQR